MTYKITLTDRTALADDVLLVTFTKSEDFTFHSGQHAFFTPEATAPVDAVGPSRYFSLLSIPDDDCIQIVVRVRDTAFKHYLVSCPLGSVFLIEAPKGKLTTAIETSEDKVFLAGGIGISPFISLVRNRLVSESTSTAHWYLVHSHRAPALPFVPELQKLANEHSWFTFIPTLTSGASAPAETENTGRITEELLTKYLPQPNTKHYYIAGAPAFVLAMKTLLGTMSIPDEHISAEDFCGYSGFTCPHCQERYQKRLLSE